MEEKDRLFYQEELDSNGCVCGKAKKPGYSFCFNCSAKLPWGVKRDLIRRPLGEEYREAYEEAVKLLDQEEP